MKLIQGHSKKCSNNILESFRLPGVKRIFAKSYLCANFQNIWASSKSRKLHIKQAISASWFGIFFFLEKRITILLLHRYQVFIILQDHLHFFMHFVFSFMGQLFMDDPISPYMCISNGIPVLWKYNSSFPSITYWI